MATESKTCKTCERVYASEADFLRDTSRWRVCSLGHLWFNCSCESTLIIPKGKFEWYSPANFMSEEAKGVFNKLGGLKDLPHIPNQIMRLQQLTADPTVEPEELAKAAKEEPFVAATILQIADNIRKLRNPSTPPIESMVHAIVYIGRAQMSDIVVSAALHSFKLPESSFDQSAYWHESYLTGAISEYIGKSLAPEILKDHLYIAGTLANIGKLVTTICFPTLATKISRDIIDVKKLPHWRQAEAEYKFPEHTILGEIAASLWGMPVYVLEAARHHHTPPKPGTPPTISHVVGFANQLTHWLLLQPSRMEEPLMLSYREFFGLSESDVDRLVNEIMPLRETVSVSAS